MHYSFVHFITTNDYNVEIHICNKSFVFIVLYYFQSCADYLKMAQNHGHKLVRALQHEKEQRIRLQEMVETLAQQHSKLEQAANAHTQRPAGERNIFFSISC